jgi:hypothetical protein
VNHIDGNGAVVNSVVKLPSKPFNRLRAMAGGQMPIALHQAEIAPAALSDLHIKGSHDQGMQAARLMMDSAPRWTSSS